MVSGDARDYGVAGDVPHESCGELSDRHSRRTFDEVAGYSGSKGGIANKKTRISVIHRPAIPASSRAHKV